MIFLLIGFVLIVIALAIDIAVTIAALKRLEKSQERLEKAIEDLKKRLR